MVKEGEVEDDVISNIELPLAILPVIQSPYLIKQIDLHYLQHQNQNYI